MLQIRSSGTLSDHRDEQLKKNDKWKSAAGDKSARSGNDAGLSDFKEAVNAARAWNLSSAITHPGQLTVVSAGIPLETETYTSCVSPLTHIKTLHVPSITVRRAASGAAEDQTLQLYLTTVEHLARAAFDLPVYSRPLIKSKLQRLAQRRSSDHK